MGLVDGARLQMLSGVRRESVRGRREERERGREGGREEAREKGEIGREGGMEREGGKEGGREGWRESEGRREVACLERWKASVGKDLLVFLKIMFLQRASQKSSTMLLNVCVICSSLSLCV